MLSVIPAAKWTAQRPYSSLLPWVYLTIVTVNSREVSHAEEEELWEAEQMACCLFLLWAWQMRNESNYISGREKPSKTFAIYGAGFRATEWHQVHSCTTCSGVAMVTIDMLPKVIPWTTHHLGKEEWVWKQVPPSPADDSCSLWRQYCIDTLPSSQKIKLKRPSFLMYLSKKD